MLPTRLAADTLPGGVIRDSYDDADLRRLAPDSVALPAATMLYLTSGRADWLSGRLVVFSPTLSLT
jgi:hypothetical protein